MQNQYSHIEYLNIINYLDQIGNYKISHLMTTGYKLLSSARGTFTRIDHKLGHEASLNKF